MIFWLLLAAMTGAAVMSVLWPLSRHARSAAPGDADARFYRDQIREIARDEENGLLRPDEAEGARAEAGRVLLRGAAARPLSEAGGEPALRRRRAASAFGLCVVPLVALGIYGGLGSPDLPASPIAARVATPAEAMDVDAALARIEQHLADHPDDARGWDVVAPIYLRLERFEAAEKAYASAIRLNGPEAARLVGRGEAAFGANGGVVTAPAREAFEQAAALDPAGLKARFYLGLAAEQDGDGEAALRAFETALAAAPGGSPWHALLQEKIAALRAPSTGAAAAGFQPGTVPPEVRAMVEGLAERLAAGGGSAAEWGRLVRSYAVLGERDKAEATLTRARTALAGRPEAEAELAEAARGVGLAPREVRP